MHNENSLTVNPNKGYANASSRIKLCPNKLSYSECQPHTPDPVRVCANSNTDHANGEKDPLTPYSKTNEDISDPADSREHPVGRSEDSKSTTNEEANEPPQAMPGSVRSVSSNENKHLERGNPNCSSCDNLRTYVSEKSISNCSLACLRKTKPSQKTSTSEIQTSRSRNIGSGQLGRSSSHKNLVIINPNYNEHYRPTVEPEGLYYNQPRSQKLVHNHGGIVPRSLQRST